METISGFRPASWAAAGSRAGTRSPQPVVVRPPHDLDMLSGQRLVTTVSRITAHTPTPQVQVLLGRVTFADVAGVRALLACRDLVRRRGGDVIFVDMSPAVHRILVFAPALRAQLEGEG